MMPMFLASIAAEGAVDAATSLDFSDALTTGLGNITSSYGKYALIAIPIALGIWAAPKAIRLIMNFFNSMTH